MPELPEVETMRMQLEKFLVGSTINKVDVSDKNILNGDSKNILAKVIKVRRFAKVTSIDLSNGYSILTHVKLTGQFIYRGPKLKIQKNFQLKLQVVHLDLIPMLHFILVMVGFYIITISEGLVG